MSLGGPSSNASFLPDGDSGGKVASGTRAIAIIANDKVMHWLLPFLESWKATNSTLPVHLIPYDDQVERTREIAALYGVQFSDIDCRELDALSKKLYPVSFGKRYRLRKLLSLALPLDEVIYFDVDIILFRDLKPVFGLIEPGVTDFIVVTRTDEYVYNKRSQSIPYLRDAFTFNDGFFVTSNKVLDVQDFYDAMEADERTFDTVRQRGGLFAQPLTNFVVHRKGLKIKALWDVVPGASGESYHKADNVVFGDDGPTCSFNGQVYFAHWPGVTGVPKGGVFDAAWQTYAKLADARVAQAGL